MTTLPPNPEKIGVSTHLSSSVRSIVVWPSLSLHQPCNEVEVFDIELQQLLLDMCVTMVEWNGIGLAAPQVGVHTNVIVTGIRKQYPLEKNADDTTPTQYSNSFADFRVFINPKIMSISDQTTSNNEGCLSIPGYFELRQRPQSIILQYQDPNEKWHSEKFDGLEAFVIQHEVDHLQGKLFIDELSLLKKDRIKRKVIKNLHLVRG